MTGHEIEVKLHIPQLDSAIGQVKNIGAELETPRFFEDNFLLDDPRHTLRNQQQLLRIRTVKAGPAGESTETVLTFKGMPEIIQGMKKREELECTFHEEKNLLEILSRLGYSVIFRYQKYRTLYRFSEKRLLICVDETPIGNYFELEGDPEIIHECAKRLGYVREQYIAESYAFLYFQWCREKGHSPNHMVFDVE